MAEGALESLKQRDFEEPLPPGMQMPVPEADSPERRAVVQSVAASPSYAALSFSRLLGTGAPLASCGRVLPSLTGIEDFLVTPGGERIPVRYAVVESERLISRPVSEDLFSPGRSLYSAELPLLVVSGFLRAVGLDEAYRGGRAEDYRRRLLEDAGFLGVSARRTRTLHRPVLVRLMPAERVSPALSLLGNEPAFQLEPLPEEQAAPISAQTEFPTQSAPARPIPTLWLEDDGRPSLASYLEFIRRRAVGDQAGCWDAVGLPRTWVCESFRRTELLSAFGESVEPLLNAAVKSGELSRVADAMLAAVPLAQGLERAGVTALTSLFSEAASYAVCATGRGVPLLEKLRQGELTVSLPAQYWLFHAASSGREEKKDYRACLRRLEETLSRRSTRRARHLLAQKVAENFAFWLISAVPARMQAFYRG